MTCEQSQNRLDDFVDGALDAVERAQVTEHLQGCATCRTDLRQIESLVRMAGELQGMPGPSTFEDLSDALQRPVVRRRRTFSMAQMAAAALVFAMVGAGVNAAWTPTNTPELAPDVELQALRSAVAELETVWEASDHLGPETRDRVEGGLRAIDEAIAGIENALESHPDDAFLRRSLVRAYGQKLDVLSRLARPS